jgi:hypothetical protein
MSKPDATYSAEVERVVHAAVASAMTDFAALLLAYGRKGLLLRYYRSCAGAGVVSTTVFARKKSFRLTGVSSQRSQLALTRICRD